MTPAVSVDSIQLVRGRWVLTDGGLLTEGAVAIQGDTILEVGAWETLHARYVDATVLGSRQYVVLPGLINAHHHSKGTPNSLLGVEDDFLEFWLFANNALRSQDPTLKTLLSAASLLKSGVTTVLDVASIGGTAAASRQNLQSRLSAYEQAGLRVALAPGASYDSFLVHGAGQDAAFLASLPEALRRQVQTLTPPQQELSSAAYLEIVSDAVRQYKSHPHIQVWFGPPGPQWVGDDLLLKIAALAESLDTGIQTHALESFYEKLIGPRCYGKSVIAHLHALGVLSPRFSIAHGVWLSKPDIEVLATTGSSVSHNPSSNLRLRAGVAPLNQLLAAGVTVGLGMDGTTLNDDEDMFTEMRLAARLHRTPQIQGPAPSLENIFHLATAGGAKLLRREQSLGKLAPGYRADIVLVKCDRITWPWVAPEANPLSVVLMRTRAADVDTVLINGRVVLKSGQPTGFDLQALGEDVAAQLAATPDRAAYHSLAKVMRPYLAQWYAKWPVPELNPFAAFNSRE
ncbi:MAG: amidohydrolase family protein [Pseudanabaenales cyanobacterium]|nr:amidohydrolase family protein [Pseudanabaenales cyanobacterium]